jgi:hypothetical protein
MTRQGSFKEFAAAFIGRECGSYSSPVHHCLLMCQACRDGTCSRSSLPVNPTINTGQLSFVQQTPATTALATTARWTPLVELLGVVGMVSLVSVGLILVSAVAAKLDDESNRRRIEHEREKSETTLFMMKELIKLSRPSAF